MFRSMLSFFCIILITGVFSCAFAETETLENPGFMTRVSHAIGTLFSKLGHFFGSPDTDVTPLEPIDNKDSADLIRHNAKVSEKLHLQYAGPRGDEKPTKESVDLKEVENQTAPLPKPEEPSVNNDKNLPVRKKIAIHAELDRIKNEKDRVGDIDKKVLSEMPPVPLSTTVNAEIAADEPHSIDKLEADFASGNVPNETLSHDRKPQKNAIAR